MGIPNSVRYFQRLNEVVKELASEMKGEKMADFIDKQATMNAVGLTTDAINFNPTKYIDVQGNELVAVVRCKDCKYFDHSDFGKGEEYWCKHFVSTDDYTHCHKVTENDFCAWGERKEDAKIN